MIKNRFQNLQTTTECGKFVLDSASLSSKRPRIALVSLGLLLGAQNQNKCFAKLSVTLAHIPHVGQVLRLIAPRICHSPPMTELPARHQCRVILFTIAFIGYGPLLF